MRPFWSMIGRSGSSSAKASAKAIEARSLRRALSSPSGARTSRCRQQGRAMRARSSTGWRRAPGGQRWGAGSCSSGAGGDGGSAARRQSGLGSAMPPDFPIWHIGVNEASRDVRRKNFCTPVDYSCRRRSTTPSPADQIGELRLVSPRRDAATSGGLVGGREELRRGDLERLHQAGTASPDRMVCRLFRNEK